MERIVSLEGVSVRYDDCTAIENASLDIFDNDFIGIIGPNGGGKTSLIKAILGSVSYEGRIEIAPSLFRNGQRLIGYMPQQSIFDRTFPITVADVVMSGLQSERGFWHRYGSNERQRAAELMQRTGIDAIANRQIGEISGGQMQRALLCRAIIAEPRLLIMDEPTTYVDNQFEGELYAMLEQLSAKMAIVMVSHDVGTISSHVKSIVCVNRTVHRHDSNVITQEQLDNYNCPIQIVTHGHVAHTVLRHHENDGCCGGCCSEHK
ncbi:MAG: ATP-binding cassette domain-containing protein [Alistipes sp.]|nr:ATP-binding cassette domain-containing protein [Alistipes sp.]